MTTVAQLLALTASVQAATATLSGAVALVATLEPSPEDLRSELDGVNAEFDALKGARDIALTIAADTATTSDERLALIVQTLGPQE
jgi:hypothetical protein